jgi:hypothetical protein
MGRPEAVQNRPDVLLVNATGPRPSAPGRRNEDPANGRIRLNMLARGDDDDSASGSVDLVYQPAPCPRAAGLKTLGAPIIGHYLELKEESSADSIGLTRRGLAKSVVVPEEVISMSAAGTVIEALAAEWLVFATWTAFGMLLAFLFRQSGLAVGIGLVYMLILEGLVLTLLSQVGGQWVMELRKLLPSPAASALADSFGQSGSALATRAAAQALIGAQRATITLGVYVVAFCTIAAIVFRRRDVME